MLSSLRALCERSGLNLDQLDTGQRWVVFAALEVMALVGVIAGLRRILGFFLSHCGMDLSSRLIGSIINVSDRAVRQSRGLSPSGLLRAIRSPSRGHRKAKLLAEHAGIVARFLVRNSGARVKTILDFIRTDLGVEMDRLTLRRYMKRYGLGVLRGDVVDSDSTPLLSARRASEGRSCSCGKPSSFTAPQNDG